MIYADAELSSGRVSYPRIHVISAISYQVRMIALHRRAYTPVEAAKVQAPAPGFADPANYPSKSPSAQTSISNNPNRNWLAKLILTFKSEVTVCANRDASFEFSQKVKVSYISLFLNTAAGVMGWVHVILGIIIFSSLQFVTVNDVMNHVLWRYIISTAACRVVLLIEIAGMRTEKK
jgi:hypothetical protein